MFNKFTSMVPSVDSVKSFADRGFQNAQHAASKVSQAAQTAASKACDATKDLGNNLRAGGETCCVGLCPKAGYVTCVICQRHFCKSHKHNLKTVTKGLSRKPDDVYCVPKELKATNRSTILKSISDNFGSKEFVCCYPLDDD